MGRPYRAPVAAAAATRGARRHRPRPPFSPRPARAPSPPSRTGPRPRRSPQSGRRRRRWPEGDEGEKDGAKKRSARASAPSPSLRPSTRPRQPRPAKSGSRREGSAAGGPAIAPAAIPKCSNRLPLYPLPPGPCPLSQTGCRWRRAAKTRARARVERAPPGEEARGGGARWASAAAAAPPAAVPRAIPLAAPHTLTTVLSARRGRDARRTPSTPSDAVAAARAA